MYYCSTKNAKNQQQQVLLLPAKKTEIVPITDRIPTVLRRMLGSSKKQTKANPDIYTHVMAKHVGPPLT